MNEVNKIAIPQYSLQRILRKLLLTLSVSPIFTGNFRCKILKWAGVNIGGQSFIGANVIIDTLHPELISIGQGCVITSGTCILSHFYSTQKAIFYLGKVHIGKNVFIGMNTIIVKAVTIGDNAVIGAGSIITCDIPSGEIWAGNPAKFIKKVGI
ncbi:acyltransferase [Bacteroides cutis]|jgi:acetyltransferase-like isoleucine patch superfamily enzyme|uniref:acyltransferase n=1 Tax=Bacteroides cutis TaxID=2024197 RepID=UPI000C7831E0|nr:acyltransferase [Bacteroides cutis]